MLSWRPRYDIHYPRSAFKDTETDILHHEGHERQNSDDQVDVDSTRGGQDTFIDDNANGSDTEMVNGTPGSLAGQQTRYEGCGGAFGVVTRFEQEFYILSQDPWLPFTREQGFKLASWVIHNKVSKFQINGYFTNRLGTSSLAGYY